MKIGVGLPATIPGVESRLVLGWAARADEGPFSSLGIIDRIAYSNYEPLITLAAAAALTKRVRLMTTILLATLRQTGVMAKQLATLDALSSGRLTVGIGVGGREDDFKAAPSTYKGRGKRLERQLAMLKKIWAGERLSAKAARIGPSPAQDGGPEILLGGYTPTPIKRIARWGNGFISGGFDPASASSLYRIAEEAWKAAIRRMYVLCPRAGQRARSALLARLLRVYGRRVGEHRQRDTGFRGQSKGRRSSFQRRRRRRSNVWPCIPELDQLERLSQAVGQLV